MKTHELAKALVHLSRVLRAGPNVEFEELTNLSTYLSQPRQSKAVREQPELPERAEKGAGLALLAEMANYSKQELIDLVAYLGIPVEARKADAVRDILGKTLKFIQDNPEFRNNMVQDARQVPAAGRASSLARALSILMNQP